MNLDEILASAKSIKFIPEMLQAILDGRKTQTRRVIDPQPTSSPLGFCKKTGEYGWWENNVEDIELRMPKYKVGEVLCASQSDTPIFLRVTGVQAERLQNITPEDAHQKEGVAVYKDSDFRSLGNESFAIEGFKILWDSIYAERGFGWETNPWVWVYEFEKVVTGEIPCFNQKI